MNAKIKTYDAHLLRTNARLRSTYDDSTAIIASGLTRSTIRTLIEYKVMETPWANGELISLDTSHPEGASSVDWFLEEEGDGGGDGFIAPDGSFPRVDIQGEHQVAIAHTMGCSFGYDLQELLSYEMAGLGGSLPTRKGRAARRYHDRKFNTAVMTGNAKKGITGVLNQPGSYQIQAGVYAGTTGNWTGGATPEQVTDTFQVVYDAIFDGSNGTLRPNTAVLPSRVMKVLRRQNSLANGDSIMKWLKETFPEITKWHIDPRMNTAGLGGTSAMLVYNRDKDHLAAITPMWMRPLPIYIKHQKTEQAFMSRFAGLFCPFPGSIALLSGIA